MSDNTPLTDAERAELEELRAQKAEREALERARRERAELEQLRAERDNANSRSVKRHPDAGAQEQLSARERQARERARKLMEPGEDLSMPLGQKIVLIGLALVVLVIVATTLFSSFRP